jgi:glutathione S-transferase
MVELEIIGGALSNYVWTCRIAAAEKGVPYRLTEVWPHTEIPTAIHPLGKIPVMRHGSVELAESRAICLYIDRAFDGPALVPATLAEAAAVEQWISIVNTAIDPLCMRQYVAAYVFPGTPEGSPDRARIEAALPKMEPMLTMLDGAVAGGFLGREAFSLADAFAFPILCYVARLPEGAAMTAKLPRLSAWLKRIEARPSVAASLPPQPG